MDIRDKSVAEITQLARDVMDTAPDNGAPGAVWEAWANSISKEEEDAVWLTAIVVLRMAFGDKVEKQLADSARVYGRGMIGVIFLRKADNSLFGYVIRRAQARGENLMDMLSSGTHKKMMS